MFFRFMRAFFIREVAEDSYDFPPSGAVEMQRERSVGCIDLIRFFRLRFDQDNVGVAAENFAQGVPLFMCAGTE